MPDGGQLENTGLDPAKFQHPKRTAKGEARASVNLNALRTLWLNTGSLCNISCATCYMDSTPKNDRLAYLRADDARTFIDEALALDMGLREIGFTGGEPFMNPDIIEMLNDALARNLNALVLTNAMKPLWQKREKLLALRQRLGEKLTLRVSIDHPTRERHEQLRGQNTWEPMMRGLTWLAENHFNLTVAGRTYWQENETATRAAYGKLFTRHDLGIDATDPKQLVLFPEMDISQDVPEITTKCWSLLNVHPDDMMCATSRMVVRDKGAAHAHVMPCTLLPYEARFKLGESLRAARDAVALNHPHCARFCVLGGASCSAG